MKKGWQRIKRKKNNDNANKTNKINNNEGHFILDDKEYYRGKIWEKIKIFKAYEGYRKKMFQKKY